jgi:hypothetical protein
MCLARRHFPCLKLPGSRLRCLFSGLPGLRGFPKKNLRPMSIWGILPVVQVSEGFRVAESGTAANIRNQKRGTTAMRFMVMVKATKDSEAGVMPSEQLLTEMGKFNEELANAGVILAGEGLHPSSKGARVTFHGKERIVTDGPFAETKELVAGFWIWNVKSKEEAIEWAKRCPNPHNDGGALELRQLFEAEDFGAEFTPELREQEERVSAKVEKRKAS